MEKQDMGTCGHFSIRGYVAEIRRKDSKVCWPFSTIGDNEEPGEQIDMFPELHVPEFRWWWCQSCLRNSDASDAATETRVVSDLAEENIREGRRGNGNTSMDVIGDECSPMIRIDIDNNEKEMMPNVLSNTREDIFTPGDLKKSRERNLNKVVTTVSCCEAKDAKHLNGGRITEDAVAGVGFGTNNLKYASKISSEICQKGNPEFFFCKSNKLSEQERELTTPKLSEPGNGGNEVQNSVNVHTIKPHFSEFDDSDGNEDADDTHDQHPANQIGNSSRNLHYKKSQKVRLLTDIVTREVLSLSSKILHSNEIANSDRSNVGKGTMGKKKKRKTPHVEALGSLQMSWSRSAQYSNRDETYSDSAVANSESANDAFAQTGSDSGFENHLIENKMVEKLIQSKKKNKKSSLKNWHEALSRELQLLNSDVGIKRSGVEKVWLKPAQDASTRRRLHLFPKTYAAAQKYDRKSISCTKEIKMLQDEDGQACSKPQEEGMQRDDRFVEINQVGDASFPPNSAVDAFSGSGIDLGFIGNKKQANMPQIEEEDSSPMYQYANVKCTGNGIVPFKAAQDAIMEKGLHSSLKHHMAIQRSSKKSILQSKSKMPKVKGGKNASLTPWQGAMPKEDRIISVDVKIKHVEAAIVPFKNSPDVCSERGMHFGLKGNKVNRRKTSANKKPHRTMQLQGVVSPIGPEDYSCACNNENLKDASGQLQVNNNQSDERLNKACEPESLEDIPMEIVELLAKSRHKRRLLEAEYANSNKFGVPETIKNVKNAVNMEFAGALENDMFGLLQETNSHMQKPLSSYAGGDISSTGGNVEPMEEKLSSYLSHLKRTSKGIGSNINHLNDPDDTKGFPAFMESLEMLSSGNQFVNTGSGRNFGIQSCGWNGNLIGRSCSLTCLQPFGAHSTSQIISRRAPCKEAQHVCSPNVADSPSGCDRFKNFATNHQKPSEIFQRMSTEQEIMCRQMENVTCPKMMGSSGLDTNEIMPAMHLLRLIDAGVSSRASMNMDGYQKFPSQPSLPENHCRNKPCLLEDGVFKLYNASKYPKPTSFDNNHGVGKSCEQFSHGPTLNAVSGKMAFRTIKSISKGKTNGSYLPMQSTDLRLSGSVSGTGCLGKNNELFPIHYLEKGLFPASNSMVLPLQRQLAKDSTTRLEVNKIIGKNEPVKSSCGTEFCSVNRNPADFSKPEAGNEFMIGVRDSKYWKMFLKRDSRHLINTDCHKRQRLKKPSAMKLHVQH